MIFFKKLLRIAISVVVVCGVSNIYAMRKTLVKDKHRLQENKKNEADHELVWQINKLLCNARAAFLYFQKQGMDSRLLSALLKLQQDQNNIKKNGNFGLLSHKVTRPFFVAKKIIKAMESMARPIQSNIHQRAQSIPGPRDRKLVDSYDGDDAVVAKRSRTGGQYNNVSAELKNLADEFKNLYETIAKTTDSRVFEECKQKLAGLELINHKIDVTSACVGLSANELAQLRDVYIQAQEMLNRVQRVIAEKGDLLPR